MAFCAGMLIVHYGPPTPDTESNENETDSLPSLPPVPSPAAVCPSSVTSPPPSSSSHLHLEERLFWSFVSLMHSAKHSLSTLYNDDNHGLHLVYDVFSEALQARDPVLAGYLEQVGAHPSLWLTSWILTVYSHRFRLGFASRAWDGFIRVGLTHLISVALAILDHVREWILPRSLIIHPSPESCPATERGMQFERVVPFLAQVGCGGGSEAETETNDSDEDEADVVIDADIPSPKPTPIRCILPDDLPLRALTESFELPKYLREKLQPTTKTTNSFKKSRHRL